MSDRATALNPNVLRWARERAGYSLDEAAERLKVAPATLRAWESAAEAPTFVQLEALATRLYKRPVALFFFPEPPVEPDARKAFRTLPVSAIEELEPDSRYAVREALGLQESLRELAGSRNPASRLIVKDLHARPTTSVAVLARTVRTYLGVTLADQSAWKSSEEAFKEWRQRFEDAGVFVFKRSFKQKDISGFCLYHPVFPVLMINNGTAHARQVFSLFHELAHLLYSVGGVTLDDLSYLDQITGQNRAIEVACNAFAAEFLMPASSFPWSTFRSGNVKDQVAVVARKYNVSREVVLRRLRDRGVVDENTYEQWANEWNRQFMRSRAARSGGNYYATQATYLGPSFLQLAFSQFHSGKVSVAELATHLGVKARNVARLEDFVLRPT